MRNWNRSEICGAFGFVGLGAGALLLARSYPMGTVVRMGPGFFPVMLGGLLILVGAVIALQSSRIEERSFDFRIKPFGMILGGILIWAVLVDHGGFLIATVLMVLCCTAVERETTWKSAAALATGLCIVGYVVFVQGIGIPLSLFGE